MVKPEKEVPLVLYIDGEKKVIGTGHINEEGNLVGTITDPEIAKTITDRMKPGEYSIQAVEDPLPRNIFEWDKKVPIMTIEQRIQASTEDHPDMINEIKAEHERNREI